MRRPFQFSLRTMVLAITWVAIVCVFWSSSDWLVGSLPGMTHRRLRQGIRAFLLLLLLGYFAFRTGKTAFDLRDTEL